MAGFGFPFASPFGSGFSFVPGPGGVSLSDLDPTPAGGLAGSMDQLINPTTGDYVRNDVGEWVETADTRTTMLLMLSIELDACPFDPGDGTTIGSLLRDGDPVTPETVRSETERAAGILQSDGLIADLEVRVRDDANNILRDSAGRLLVRTSWRDLASGTPVDLILGAG